MSSVPCQCNTSHPHTTPSVLSSSGETNRLPTRQVTSSGTPVWVVEGPNAESATTVTTTPTTEPRTGDITCCQLLQPDSSTDNLLEKCDATTTSSFSSNTANGFTKKSEKREVCCKDQVEPERNLVNHDLVRDIIIGLSDGLMVPFALTAGLSSLGSSRLVYQGGFAELVSGAISMGIGGYLSAKGEQDIFRHRFTSITSRLEIACASEIDREIHGVLGPIGVNQGVSKLVARSLEIAQRDEEGKEGVVMKPDEVQGVEKGVRVTPTPGLAVESNKISWRSRLGLVSKPKVPTRGTSAFLLKFGEGMEEVPSKRLFISAFTIGFSYFIGGLIPIIPYLCVSDALHGLYWSILATGIILLIFGVAKSWFTGAATGVGGLIWGAVSTLAVGTAAAAASYGVVKALERNGS